MDMFTNFLLNKILLILVILLILQLITWKKTRLNGYADEFSVDYNIIDTSNIIDIRKYLMKKHDIK